MAGPRPTPEFKNAFVRWVDYRLPIFSFLQKEAVDYPTPRNLSYWWNFGSLAGVMLVIMIFSGIFLAMNYQPNADLAYDSVEHIMRDVNYGWLIRYIHMNGASMFFIVVYIHLFRGIYYGSYKAPREILWILGVMIVIAMMAAAFEGYVLPWGQQSYWAATVITNLFSAIPYIGNWIVTLLWGGFSVSNPTLNRFFALHYLVPFIILGLVCLHLVALHQHGSNNPLGIDKKGPQDSLPFHPYYTAKDAYGLAVFLLIYAYFVFFNPDFFGDPDNSIPANPLSTPAHIVPDWYFLPFYAILRAITVSIVIPFTGITLIPAKLGGVICMFGAILILFALPWLDTSKVRSAKFRPVFRIFFWLLVVDCFVLGWVGANPPLGNFIVYGQIGTAYYFAHFLIITPLLGKLERTLPLPVSISEEVLKAYKKSGGGVRAAAVPMEKP
jgi:quinol-cytochrome oxidoreductase complex cytochrome b subunit